MVLEAQMGYLTYASLFDFEQIFAGNFSITLICQSDCIFAGNISKGSYFWRRLFKSMQLLTDSNFALSLKSSCGVLVRRSGEAEEEISRGLFLNGLIFWFISDRKDIVSSEAGEYFVKIDGTDNEFEVASTTFCDSSLIYSELKDKKYIPAEIKLESKKYIYRLVLKPNPDKQDWKSTRNSQWQRQVLDRRNATLHGNMEDADIVIVVQSVASSGKTGVIVFYDGADNITARIDLNSGIIVHAEYGHLKDEYAVYQLILDNPAQRFGFFKPKPGMFNVMHTCHHPIDFLLINACKLLDEISEQRTFFVSPFARLRRRVDKLDLKQYRRDEVDLAERVFTANKDEMTICELLARVPYDESTTLQTLRALVRSMAFELVVDASQSMLSEYSAVHQDHDFATIAPNLDVALIKVLGAEHFLDVKLNHISDIAGNFICVDVDNQFGSQYLVALDGRLLGIAPEAIGLKITRSASSDSKGKQSDSKEKSDSVHCEFIDLQFIKGLFFNQERISQEPAVVSRSKSVVKAAVMIALSLSAGFLMAFITLRYTHPETLETITSPSDDEQNDNIKVDEEAAPMKHPVIVAQSFLQDILFERYDRATQMLLDPNDKKIDAQTVAKEFKSRSMLKDFLVGFQENATCSFPKRGVASVTVSTGTDSNQQKMLVIQMNKVDGNWKIVFCKLFSA